MAITKIHPIKVTLDKAIAYIVNGDKTEDQILVDSFGCLPVTAHMQFMNTREEKNVQGTVLARHLIQSFYPGEVTPEKAHEIGLELAEKILGGEYEFVLATHVDKEHIHNHFIWNNVNFKTGKCYKSNKKSYHKIREESDRLCEKNHLVVIDEYYEAYKKKYKTRGTSWYEDQQKKKGKSWKSKLQFDIDRAIKKAKDWEDFLAIMDDYGYERKNGKYISFRKRDGQKRFTRAMRIGEDYTEERLKERIEHEVNFKSKHPKAPFKPVESVIDISANEKIKGSPGYEFWATKHNIHAMADTINQVRNEGFKTRNQLEEALEESASKVQNLLTKNKKIEKEIEKKKKLMENRHVIDKYRQIYMYAKKHPKDKAFAEEYSPQLTVYKAAAKEVFRDYKVLPKTKDILKDIDELETQRKGILDELQDARKEKDRLYQYKRNYDVYLGKHKDMER